MPYHQQRSLPWRHHQQCSRRNPNSPTPLTPSALNRATAKYTHHTTKATLQYRKVIRHQIQIHTTQAATNLAISAPSILQTRTTSSTRSKTTAMRNLGIALLSHLPVAPIPARCPLRLAAKLYSRTKCRLGSCTRWRSRRRLCASRRRCVNLLARGSGVYDLQTT